MAAIAITAATCQPTKPPKVNPAPPGVQPGANIEYFTITNDSAGSNQLRSTIPFTRDLNPGPGEASTGLNADGSVDLDIDAAPQYADAGMYLVVGSLGDISEIVATATGPVGMNLWFDTGDDGEFFTWTSDVTDEPRSEPRGLGGILTTIDDSTTFFVLPQPSAPDTIHNKTLAQLKAGVTTSAGTINQDTTAALWIGVCCAGTSGNPVGHDVTITSLTLNGDELLV